MGSIYVENCLEKFIAISYHKIERRKNDLYKVVVMEVNKKKLVIKILID